MSFWKNLSDIFKLVKQKNNYHSWKKHVKISKTVKFEGNFFQTHKNKNFQSWNFMWNLCYNEFFGNSYLHRFIAFKFHSFGINFNMLFPAIFSYSVLWVLELHDKSSLRSYTCMLSVGYCGKKYYCNLEKHGMI